MRHFFDKEAKKQGFKGSVLVVFGDREKAEEFLNLPEVKYNGTQLLRKWHEDYLEEKRKEIEERKARKEAKKKEGDNASQEVRKRGVGSFMVLYLFTYFIINTSAAMVQSVNQNHNPFWLVI